VEIANGMDIELRLQQLDAVLAELRQLKDTLEKKQTDYSNIVAIAGSESLSVEFLLRKLHDYLDGDSEELQRIEDILQALSSQTSIR
jgi:hypothetical protein